MSLINDLLHKAIQDKNSEMLQKVITLTRPDQKYSKYIVMEYDGDVPRLFGDQHSIELLIPKDMSIIYENAVVDAIESGTLFEDKEDIDNKVDYITMTHLPKLGMMHQHMEEPHALQHAVGMVVGALNPDGHFGSTDTNVENGKNFTLDLTKHGNEKDTSVMDLTNDYLDIKDKSGDGTPVELKRSLAKVPDEIKEINEVKAEDTVDDDDYEEVDMDYDTDDDEDVDEEDDEENKTEDVLDDEDENSDEASDDETKNSLIGAYVGTKVVKHVAKKGAKKLAKKGAKKVVKKGVEKVKQHHNDKDDDSDHDKDSDKEKSIEKFLKSRKKDVDVEIEKENGDSNGGDVKPIEFDGEAAYDLNSSPTVTRSSYDKSNISERNLSNAFSMMNHSDTKSSSYETKSQPGSIVQKFGSKKPSPRSTTSESYQYKEYDEYDYYQESHAVLVKPKKLKPIPRDVVAYIITQKNMIRDSNDQAMLSGYCCSKLELVDFYLNCLDTNDYRYIVPHNRQYLVQMQNDLNRCLQEILRIKPINRLDRVWRVNVTYPERNY